MYTILFLGEPSDVQISNLKTNLRSVLGKMELDLERDFSFLVKHQLSDIKQTETSCVLYFGAEEKNDESVDDILRLGLPILTIASSLNVVSDEIPESLLNLNCLDYSDSGEDVLATSVLECLGLLHKQRRVFLSYKRNESRVTALQLYESLSARRFNVFLDTHSIGIGAKFQDELWHELCDSDVVVMLDTENYFDSRWTTAEFGKALSKRIPIIRVAWPSVPYNEVNRLAETFEINQDDFNADQTFSSKVLQDLCDKVERVRSKGHAVRRTNILSKVREAVEITGGKFNGVNSYSGCQIELIDGTGLIVFPSIGIPNSKSLHEAEYKSNGEKCAIIYDDVGILPEWQEHIDWLGEQVKNIRWLTAHQASWNFGGWNE